MTFVLISCEFIISHVPPRDISHVLTRIYHCVNSSHHPVSQRLAMLFSRLRGQSLYQGSHIVKLLNIASLCFPKLFSSFIWRACCTAGNTTIDLPSDYCLLEKLIPYSSWWRNWVPEQQFHCYSVFFLRDAQWEHFQVDPEKSLYPR